MADKRQQTLFNFFSHTKSKDQVDDAPTTAPKIIAEAQGNENAPINLPELDGTIDSDDQKEKESPSPSPPLSSSKPDGTHNGMNPYEVERLQRIQRNMEIMRSLGLANLGKSLQSVVSSAGSSQSTKTNPSRKRPYERRPLPTHQQEARAPLRRSARHTSGSEAQSATIINEDLPNEPLTKTPSHKVYDTTNVQDYILAVATDIGQSANTASASSLAAAFDLSRLGTQCERNTTITGFAQHPTVLRDSALARIYSIDWDESGFIVAGGKDGQVSVWGIESSRASDGASSVDPLVSHRLHTGWISDVQWMSPISSVCTAPEEDETKSLMPWLLTSANDGVLCLWDLGRSDSGGTMPHCVARTSDIHSAGIFSMHESQSKVATASKDNSVVITSLSSSKQMSVVQRYVNIHDGVVKCVRWNTWQSDGATIFASCGNDRVIKITDTRCPPDCTSNKSCSNSNGILLDGQHTTTVNCVRWNPLHEHMLLSASHDDHIAIHDCRKSGAGALFKLTGHGNGRLKTIYQPAFVAAGTGVVAAGEPSSRLSLWSLNDGQLVSQGMVEGGASLNGAMHCPPASSRVELSGISTPLLCSAARCVLTFQPIFTETD